MNAYMTALISMSGIIIGASLQFLFSRLAARASRLDEMRLTAYADLLRGAAQLSQAEHFKDDKARMTSLALATDAKGRIVVYGHREVVRRLAQFGKTSQDLSSEDAKERFIQLVEAMRRSTGKTHQTVSEDDFRAIFWSE